MIRRLPYYLYLVLALAFVVLKWSAFPRDLHLAEAGRTDGYVALAWLCLVLAGVVVVIFRLRRDRPSRRAAQPGITTQNRGMPPRTLSNLPTIWRTAFARRPIAASILLLLIVSIPVLLVAFAHGGGLTTFGRLDWILVGIMELPVVCAVLATLISIFLRRQ